MNLPPELLREIVAHAQAAYPDECCGVVFAAIAEPDTPLRVRRCRNAQDDFHALDPVAFPRTARNAYFIDPKDLLAIESECRELQQTIRVIYHSHPDAGAYFSEEDHRRAVDDGEPVFPGTDYLVVSVQTGKALNARVFAWDERQGIFTGRAVHLP